MSHIFIDWQRRAVPFLVLGCFETCGCDKISFDDRKQLVQHDFSPSFTDPIHGIIPQEWRSVPPSLQELAYKKSIYVVEDISLSKILSACRPEICPPRFSTLSIPFPHCLYHGKDAEIIRTYLRDQLGFPDDIALDLVPKIPCQTRTIWVPFR